MSYKHINVRSDKNVTTITIHRPAQRNALNSETIQELSRAFDAITDDPLVRCVLLTGSGTEAFCAGADLAELRASSSPEARRSFFNALASLLHSVQTCPVPVVCAVHGFAFAGGCGLVASSDIVYASDDAVFALPEIGIGLAPMVVMAPMSRVMNVRLLQRMALAGERIGAADALAGGLITRMIEKGSLSSVAQSACSSIADHSPAAVRATKVQLSRVTGAGSDHDSLLHELADQSALVSIGDDAVEGIAAFFEKRRPRWRQG